MSVRILVTGGTFDKEYDEIKGELFFSGYPYAGDIGPRTF